MMYVVFILTEEAAQLENITLRNLSCEIASTEEAMT